MWSLSQCKKRTINCDGFDNNDENNENKKIKIIWKKQTFQNSINKKFSQFKYVEIKTTVLYNQTIDSTIECAVRWTAFKNRDQSKQAFRNRANRTKKIKK